MTEKKIIGREEELKILRSIRQSKEAEFLAIYGRRRIGKTFLIREYFSDKGIFLEVSGVKGLRTSKQLENFASAMSKTFFASIPIKTPSSWNAAFELLTQQIEKVSKTKKVIVFLDELPWLASKKSGFLLTLDYYWNQHWSKMHHLILIACGSAASWMLEHVVHAKGGLYNRVTKKILLRAFSLREVEIFLKSRNINLKKQHIADLYMAIGGIPFYLKEIEKGQSTSQIIDRLCFNKNGALHNEFEAIFKSLFDQAEINRQIVREIVKSGNCISRKKLIKAIKISSGGTLDKRLDELIASQFVGCFVPLGKRTRDRFYRIIDEYTLFYLRWLEPLVRSGVFASREGYWQKIAKTPEKLSWAGYAFESICFKHVNQIAKTLGIECHYESGSWRHFPGKKTKESGTQIDLIFDRNDQTITLFEIKYSDKQYVIDKSYATFLECRKEIFEHNYPTKKNPTKKQIFLAMISTYGVKKNMYSEDVIQNQVTLTDLFK